MNVLVKSSNGITQVSADAKLLSQRKVFIEGEISPETACEFIKKIIVLNAENQEKFIDVLINSPGGEINSGLAMYDVIQSSKAPIRVFCIGRLFYVSRQVIFVLIGIMFMIVGAHIDIAKGLYKLSKFLYVTAIMLLILLVTPLGVSSHGATRWLRVPFIQLQPVEIAKLAVIVLLAAFIYKKNRYSKSIKFTIYCWIVGIIPALLTLKVSSDLSSALVIMAITFGLTFIFNRTKKMHIVVLLTAVGLIAGYILHIKSNLPDPAHIDDYSYRIARIVAWLYPDRYSDAAYQSQTALYSIGSGGFWGVGLGRMYVNIPEGQTDFIFVLLTHQLGIFGGICLILCYVYLLFQILKIALNACSLYETILVIGILIHIATQVVVNMGVCTSLLPNTGLPLVLMSYGGSSILTSFAELAICVSVSKKSVVKVSKKIAKEELG